MRQFSNRLRMIFLQKLLRREIKLEALRRIRLKDDLLFLI